MNRFDLPDVSTRDLIPIVAVAEHRSFVRAAAFLKVTQPLLTRTVKKVERPFGVLLFDRNTRRVNITPAGHEPHHGLDVLGVRKPDDAATRTRIPGRTALG